MKTPNFSTPSSSVTNSAHSAIRTIVPLSAYAVYNNPQQKKGLMKELGVS
jgi:hypothetical protein